MKNSHLLLSIFLILEVSCASPYIKSNKDSNFQKKISSIGIMIKYNDYGLEFLESLVDSMELRFKTYNIPSYKQKIFIKENSFPDNISTDSVDQILTIIHTYDIQKYDELLTSPIGNKPLLTYRLIIFDAKNKKAVWKSNLFIPNYYIDNISKTNVRHAVNLIFQELIKTKMIN